MWSVNAPTAYSGVVQWEVGSHSYFYPIMPNKKCTIRIMAAIEIFKNESFGEVRVAGTSENPLFCLTDICRILDIKNVGDCKSRLDQKGIVLTDTPTKGGIQSLVYINEKNLYKEAHIPNYNLSVSDVKSFFLKEDNPF